tara:strand:- start:10487 stop:11284 length:798 start_codon:yes stop_codon:yes gene_type:complete
MGILAQQDKDLQDLRDDLARQEGRINQLNSALESARKMGDSVTEHRKQREDWMGQVAVLEGSAEKLKEDLIPAAEDIQKAGARTPEQECAFFADKLGFSLDATKVLIGAIVTASGHQSVLDTVGKQALGQQNNAAAGAMIIDGYLRNLNQDYQAALAGDADGGADTITDLPLRYIAYRLHEHAFRLPGGRYSVEYSSRTLVARNGAREITISANGEDYLIGCCPDTHTDPINLKTQRVALEDTPFIERVLHVFLGTSRMITQEEE